MVDESMGINEDSMMAPTPNDKESKKVDLKGNKKSDTKGRGRKKGNKNLDPSLEASATAEMVKIDDG